MFSSHRLTTLAVAVLTATVIACQVAAPVATVDPDATSSAALELHTETVDPEVAAASPTVATHTSATPFFVALSVADMEQSVTWYRQVFGFAVVREMDLPERGITIRLLSRDGALLELIHDARAMPAGDDPRFLRHGVFKFGFLVPDLAAFVTTLESVGVPLRGEIFEEADVGTRALQIADPDGNVIQVFQRLSVPPQ